MGLLSISIFINSTQAESYQYQLNLSCSNQLINSISTFFPTALILSKTNISSFFQELSFWTGLANTRHQSWMNQMGWLESSTTGALKWILADPDQIVPGSSIKIASFVGCWQTSAPGLFSCRHCKTFQTFKHENWFQTECKWQNECNNLKQLFNSAAVTPRSS